MVYALVFIAGLIVGWNFFPQPEFVKNLVAKIKDKIVGTKTDEVK
jgi:hypothetical protein